MRFPLITVLAMLALFLGGCTQEDINRAQALDDNAHALEAKADQALAAAQTALDAASGLAKQFNSDQAQAAVKKAQDALDLASDATVAAKASVVVADSGLKAAKTAQEAGASTVDVILAALTAFLPTAGVAISAIVKAYQNGKAFTQTVRGIDVAKISLGAAVFNQHVALALSAAQDPTTRAKVDVAQGKEAA